MATTVKLFDRSALTTGSVTRYTVPASTTAVVTNIVLTNTHASNTSAATVTLNGIAILSAVVIPAASTVTFDIKQVLNTGQILAALATPATVNLHASGVEIT